MKKMVLIGMCAWMVFCPVSRTKAITDDQCLFIFGGSILTTYMLAFGGICLSVAASDSWNSLRRAERFLDGTSSAEGCALLQVVKKADFDVEAATLTVNNYLAGLESREWCDECFSGGSHCDCKEKSRFNAIRAVKDLDSMSVALTKKERKVRKAMGDWFSFSTSFLVKRYRRCLDEILKIKAFISEVIETIRKSEPYQEQLEAHEQFVKERRVRRLEDKVERKIIIFEGFPENATLQVIQKEAA